MSVKVAKRTQSFWGWASLLALPLALSSACTVYKRTYTVEACTDRDVDVRYISAATPFNFRDEANNPIAAINNVVTLKNLYEYPDNADIPQTTALQDYATLSWQEETQPLTTLTIKCYSSSEACFSLAGGQLTDIQSAYNAPPNGSSTALVQLAYLNDAGELRHLESTFTFAIAKAGFDLNQYTCDLHCEDEYDPFFCDDSYECIPDRFCDYKCDNGTVGEFTYNPGEVWSEEEDQENFSKDYSPACSLNVISEDLPALTVNVVSP